MKLGELLEGKGDSYHREVVMGLTSVLNGQFTRGQSSNTYTAMEEHGGQPILMVTVKRTIWGALINIWKDPNIYESEANEIEDKLIDAIHALPMMSKPGAKYKVEPQPGIQKIESGEWRLTNVKITYPDAALREDADDWLVVDGRGKIISTAMNVHTAIRDADRLKKRGVYAKPISRTAHYYDKDRRSDSFDRKEKERFERDQEPWLEDIPDMSWEELEELSERGGDAMSIGGDIADIHGAVDKVIDRGGKRVAARTYKVLVQYDPEDLGMKASQKEEAISDPIYVTVYRSPENHKKLRIAIK